MTEAAIHESAHAVAAHLVGAPFETVSIETEADSNGHIAMLQETLDELSPVHAAVIAAAGQIAECKHRGIPCNHLSGTDDEQFERACARAADPLATAREAFSLARALAVAKWPEILLVADELDLWQTLTSDEVGGIIQSALVAPLVDVGQG